MNVAGPIIEELQDRVRALEAALQHIMQVLGPEAPTHEDVCSGCQWEIGEALRTCEQVGVKYKGRRKAAAK